MNTRTIILKQLQILRDASNDAISEAFEKRQEISGAINWGDLCCVAAEFIVDQEGNQRVQVRIEEAAPDYGEFHEFIAKRLEENGFGNVTVLTEW
jgi:hypothetical protein